jgi:predicted amino acid racemase
LSEALEDDVRLRIECDKIRENAEAIVALAAQHGIDVVGVTKACCGYPDVARAILAGGVKALADSQLSNIRRMRAAGIDVDMMLLRLPRISRADAVVELAQVSLNSEVETVRALSRAAQTRGVIHRVVLMIETGDRREGVMPEEALEAARAIMQLPGIELVGVGANLACIGGVLPTQQNTQLLIDMAEDLEDALGVRFPVISGGHTSNLDLLVRDEMPARVNQLRVGEGILLGVNSTTGNPIPCPHQDAFTAFVEVIELKTKPSMPEGEIAVDAFGRKPHWEDHGPRARAILAVGEQYVRIAALHPRRPGVSIVGASSDHLVVDVTEAVPPVELGDELAFDMDYAAVATAMASSGVALEVVPHRPDFA